MAAKGKVNKDLTGPTSFKPYRQAKTEAYMSPKMREHFKNILTVWRQDIMNEVDKTVDHMRHESAAYPDPVDRAGQEEEFSLTLRTRDRERRLLKKIESSLEQLESDDYGYCEKCGVDIGVKRLEARPTATLCIDCKTIDEIKEKQIAS